MRRQLALIVFATLAGVAVPASSQSLVEGVSSSGLPMPRAAHATLIVMPREGHAGDTVYLSGSGFPPSRLLSSTFRCGGAWSGTDGAPRTDAHGQFVAYSGLRLRKAKPSRCSIGVGPSSAPVASASYTVLSPSRPLNPCDMRMCLHIIAALVRMSAGAQGNVAIKGWPGARVDVTITRPGGAGQNRSARLDWEGAATVRLLVAPGLQKGLQAHVYVRARLGAISGTGSQRFVLVPGGR